MYIPVCSLVIHFPLFYCHWTSGMSDSGCSSLGCKISHILENNHTVVETVLEKQSCLCSLYGGISFASEMDLF